MEKTIPFKNFKDNPDGLLGLQVLYTCGQSYSESKSRSIRKICRVTKTGFRITEEDALFGLENGSRKGLSGRMHMGTISKCELITEEYAKELRITWARNKEKKRLLIEIQTKINDITLEQAQEIMKVITT